MLMKTPIKNNDIRMINQSEIARRLGISVAYVNMILHGRKKSAKYLSLIQKEINSIKNY